MLTKLQISKLQQAIWKLEQADALIQEALGATDACQMTHDVIQDVIDDLEEDLQESGI